MPRIGQFDDDTQSPAQAVGGRAPYLGLVADGKMCTFAFSQAAVAFISQRLFNDLYDDVTEVFFGYSINYGVQETASSGTASIELSVDSADGSSRTRVTFGGQDVGIIPDTGILISDAVAIGPRTRGSKLWHNSRVTYNGAGANGLHRNCRAAYLADSGEISNAAIPAAPPANNVMAGVPVGSSAYCLRPLFIIGRTTRDTFLLLGDSINAEDYAYPYMDSGKGKSGVLTRRVSEEFACLNGAQSGDSYVSTETGARFAIRQSLGQYVTAVIDEYGVNDGALTLAQFTAKMVTMRARFPGKAYGKATLIPRTTTTDFWQTTGNQAIHGNAVNHLEVNRAIRNLVANDFFIDTAVALESAKDSRKWKASGNLIANVAVANGATSSQRILNAAAATFGQELLYTHISVANDVAQTALVIAVAADGSSITTYGSGVVSPAGSVSVMTNHLTADGLHPLIQAELLIRRDGDFSALRRFR